MQYLTAKEKINVRNFPLLRKYLVQIQDILDFEAQIVTALNEYLSKEVDYINISISDLTTYQQRLRELLEDLSAMTPIPFPLLYNLRNIQVQIGLLKQFPHLLKRGV